MRCDMCYCVGRCGSEILVEHGYNGECVATCGYCRCMNYVYYAESISLSILVCVMGVDGSRKNTHGRKSK